MIISAIFFRDNDSQLEYEIWIAINQSRDLDKKKKQINHLSPQIKPDPAQVLMLCRWQVH